MGNRETITIKSHQSASGWATRLPPDHHKTLRDASFNASAAGRFADTLGMGEESAVTEWLLNPELAESDREGIYHRELLGMFRQRLRFNAFLGLLLIPLFHLFYFFISPPIAQQIQTPHALMAGVCVCYLILPRSINSLLQAKILTAFGYAVICLGTSMVTTTLAQNQFSTLALTGVHMAMLAAHSQILLSVVLLPLSLWESLAMAAIITFSLAWSSWWATPFESGSVQTSQLFMLITTAVFVLCVTHFQSVLRRRAFDAGFDLAHSAVQLQKISSLDPVTGGFNRFYLQSTLSLEVSRAVRFGRPLSALMFDLDNFKAVNDTQGHTVGDEVLRVVNEASALAIRDVDTATRYGGDEFVIILPETEREGALEIAQRLQECVHEQLQECFGSQTPAGNVTLSIGVVSLHPGEIGTPESIIAFADERLYEAKRMGKDRIAI